MSHQSGITKIPVNSLLTFNLSICVCPEVTTCHWSKPIHIVNIPNSMLSSTRNRMRRLPSGEPHSAFLWRHAVKKHSDSSRANTESQNTDAINFHGVHPGRHCLVSEQHCQRCKEAVILPIEPWALSYLNEKFMVANTHTVVHPRTMVIHLDNASPANRAMMGPFWFICIASSAPKSSSIVFLSLWLFQILARALNQFKTA
jgi:hypothetical protein